MDREEGGGISHLGSTSDQVLINGHFHLRYTNDIHRSLNEVPDDKIRKYHPDYNNFYLQLSLYRFIKKTNNNPPKTVSFIPVITSTSGRLHSEFVRLFFLQAHRETERFFADSGVQLPQTVRDHCLFHFHRPAFSDQFKIRVVLDLGKETALRITLNLDGTPIISKSHTHPSHSQTSRLLTSSLSLGVPVPRGTQCMRVMQIPHLQVLVFHHTDNHIQILNE